MGVFLAVFAFRAGFDIAHYGTEKSQVKEAVAIQYADYDKNPSTPTEELNPSWHMYSRGYTLSDVFAENPDWFAMSYKSFCGLLQDHDTRRVVLLVHGAALSYTVCRNRNRHVPTT